MHRADLHDSPRTDTAPAVSVRGLGKTYLTDHGATVALAGVDTDFGTGELTALIGSSGSGKSTLLSIIAGLDAATDGEIVMGDRLRARGQVGMMFQRSSLMAWRTARENVLLPAELLGMDRSEASDRADHLLEKVGLSDWRDSYPSELSGGMQQRVALARVLLPDPALMLLDEPFGALDEMTRESLDIEMCRVVESGGRSMILVTHSIYEAVLVADKIVVLSAHPGTVAGTVMVPLPRPRTLDQTSSDEFRATVGEVRMLLRGEEAA